MCQMLLYYNTNIYNTNTTNTLMTNTTNTLYRHNNPFCGYLNINISIYFIIY